MPLKTSHVNDYDQYFGHSTFICWMAQIIWTHSVSKNRSRLGRCWQKFGWKSNIWGSAERGFFSLNSVGESCSKTPIGEKRKEPHGDKDVSSYRWRRPVSTSTSRRSRRCRRRQKLNNNEVLLWQNVPQDFGAPCRIHSKASCFVAPVMRKKNVVVHVVVVVVVVVVDVDDVEEGVKQKRDKWEKR